MDLFEKNDEYLDESDPDDEDFVPNDNDLEASDVEEDVEGVAKNGKSGKKKRSKKKSGDSSDDEIECGVGEKKDGESNGITSTTDEEEEKKRTDRLYNDFLLGVNKTNDKSSVPKSDEKTNGAQDQSDSSNSSTSTLQREEDGVKLSSSLATPGTTRAPGARPVPVGRISILSNSPAQIGLMSKPGIKRSGGLSAILNAIQSNKKQKLGTLEKSRLDWQAFKKDEGIDEELRTQVKGKNSFVERQQFLQRTDLRQFEIEKNLRAVQRKTT